MPRKQKPVTFDDLKRAIFQMRKLERMTDVEADALHGQDAKGYAHRHYLDLVVRLEQQYLELLEGVRRAHPLLHSMNQFPSTALDELMVKYGSQGS